MLPIAIGAMIFLTLVTFLYGIVSFAEGRRDSRNWRERVEGQTRSGEVDEEKAPQTTLQYFQQQVLGILDRLGRISEPKKAQEISALKRSLMTAGYRTAGAPTAFNGTKLLLAMGLPLVAFVVPSSTLDDLPTMQQLVVYVGLAVAGLYAPELWLRQAIRRRQLKISNGFPDALDLLVVCVEAGLGMDAAVSRSGQELGLAHPELADEFWVLSMELRAGLPRDQALQNLADRIGLEAVKSLVALMIQTDRFGTSVGQALRVYSDSMRTERALRAEERAAKLPVQLLFPLMFFIFPSLFIVILGPAIIQGMRILIPALQS